MMGMNTTHTKLAARLGLEIGPTWIATVDKTLPRATAYALGGGVWEIRIVEASHADDSIAETALDGTEPNTFAALGRVHHETKNARG
jgi:hypothetical protein